MQQRYSIYKIRTQFQEFKNYSYLVVDNPTQSAAIIDPAWEAEKILGFIQALNVKVSVILLTHHHTDHAHLASPLAQRFNVPVYIHTVEAELYQPQANHTIAGHDNDQLFLGDDTVITCIHTPGHTDGSVCYVLSDSVFTGDTVFIEGCGACDTEDMAEKMYYSIEKLKSRLSPQMRVYPGHSYGKEPGYEFSYLLENNIYFQLKKEQFIAFRMRKHQENLLNFH